MMDVVLHASLKQVILVTIQEQVHHLDLRYEEMDSILATIHVMMAIILAEMAVQVHESEK